MGIFNWFKREKKLCIPSTARMIYIDEKPKKGDTIKITRLSDEKTDDGAREVYAIKILKKGDKK